MEYDTLKKGSVWHGPWHTDLVSGRFGSPDRQHYAMCYQSTGKASGNLAFFPFTSKKTSKPLMILEASHNAFGRKDKTSYLVNVRLIISIEKLYKHFEYQCVIPEKKIAEFENNYRVILEKRKRANKYGKN